MNFEIEKGTEVVDGCGVTFAGEFWYFGGWYNERQVKFRICTKHYAASVASLSSIFTVNIESLD